jgi:HAMP domain-containing protein
MLANQMWTTIQKYRPKTLSTRLSLGVVSVIAGLFFAAHFALYTISRKVVEDEAAERAEQVLERTMLNIDNTLSNVEAVAQNVLWKAANQLANPDSMGKYAHRMVVANPLVKGIAIAFEPGNYEGKDDYFMVYSCRQRTSEGVDTIVEANSYGIGPYTKQAWYAQVKETDSSCWIEPSAYGDTIFTDAVMSYSVPIRNSRQKMVGVLSVDLSLDSLSHIVAKAKPFAHSYSTLLGKNSTYLVHPDSVYASSSLQALNQHTDPAVLETIRSMMAGENGSRSVYLGSVKHYVYFKPYQNTGWSVAIVCPEEDVYGYCNKMWRYMLFITLAGFIVLAIFSYLMALWQLRPLRTLTEMVQKIAEGKFDQQIGLSKRHDEIGRLQNSFHAMQEALSTHVKNLNQAVEVLRSRNELLGKASEQAKEDERMKTAFLYNVTGKIAEPIGVINSLVNKIKVEYALLGREEMKLLTEKINKQVDIITTLLDELISISSAKDGVTDQKPMVK